MSNLRELYIKKRDFATYRKKEMAKIQESPFKEKLKELKAKRARVLAELDAEIAQVKHRFALEGGDLISKTERRAIRATELTKEKRDIDNRFAAEIKLRQRGGTPVAQLAKECGANSLSVFYQALNFSTDETAELNSQQGEYDPSGEHWNYSDSTRVHRYGVNDSRTVFRIHDSSDHGSVCYFRRADWEPIGGNMLLADKFESERALLLLDILNNPDPDERTRPNPYKVAILD